MFHLMARRTSGTSRSIKASIRLATAFALTELTAADEARVGALVKKAVS